jgi:adenine-specific DNA-methyltransferase
MTAGDKSKSTKRSSKADGAPIDAARRRGRRMTGDGLRGSDAPLAATEHDLLSIALKLGADTVAGWSAKEAALAKRGTPVARNLLSTVRDRIRAGEDPLGECFTTLRSPDERRALGATYTPADIVQSMIAWAREQPLPARIVDPGVGSARFLRQAAAAFPGARLVGVEVDPLAAIIARANLAAAGHAKRCEILLRDYRRAKLHSGERTLFLGNPPYVRHHQIGAEWKQWLTGRARRLGLHVSQLAGLHVHFFLATVLHANAGDYGALITAAEWLDVNYGRLVRELFLGPLGGEAIVVIEPTAAPFPDAATTGAITLFRIRSQPASVRLRRVKRASDLGDLHGGQRVRRERLQTQPRWSKLTFRTEGRRQGFVELGELCRVHRGQATGANAVWIAGEHAADLPKRVLFPTITKARELIVAGRVLADASNLRSVVDLPADLDELAGEERRAVDRFLQIARRRGAHDSYLARHRRAWWSVGLRQPAPILTTYMARRAPTFTRNLAGARHINIAHGLYPRQPLDEAQLQALVSYLSTNTSVAGGRTYSGGLTKFEPGEMERLVVPSPELLARGGAAP